MLTREEFKTRGRIDSWDEFFLELAKVHARKSKDPSTQVGAVIVGPAKEVRGGGFNGMPRGVADDPLAPAWCNRYRRPEKYTWIEHAERNAIFNCARNGAATEGCVLYVAGGPLCAECARAVVQAGLSEVVCESLTPPQISCLCCGGDREHIYAVYEDCKKPPLADGRIDWRASVEIGLIMLREAGVRVRAVRRDS